MKKQLFTALFSGFLLLALTASNAQTISGACQHNHQNSAAYNHHKFTAQSNKTQAAASRSDTLDIVNYHLNLNLTDLASKELSGTCAVHLASKINNLDTILLDLKALAVSAVYRGNETNPENYEQQGELLRIFTKKTLNAADTATFIISYQGKPATATYGGFYFGNNTAYNMGVGIGIDPPNFGRAWFPCLDNFIDRATYQFSIHTKGNMSAFCNGTLQNIDLLGDGTKITHWKLDVPIPTYLASVAVGAFSTIESEYEGMNGKIPAIIAAPDANLDDAKISFQNLPQAFSGFEQAFGPYIWPRVGFTVVPFNAGAMEHATNIGYPLFAVDGTLTWEAAIMAHELSHHWWGDLVTCETAADMWLNEGWASWCENYFTELVYGPQAYRDACRTTLEDVLRQAHLADDGYRAVAGVPAEYTYGNTVNRKGAVVVNALRGYMGNEAFFKCLKEYTAAFALKNANSYQLRDFLSDCSGMDLTDFFDDWVFQPGFVAVTLDSMAVKFAGTNAVATVYLRQHTHQTNHYFNAIPVDITFYDQNLNSTTRRVFSSGACSFTQNIELPFYPIYAAIDTNETLSLAGLQAQRWITKTGNYTLPNTQVDLEVNAVSDTNLLHVYHIWAPPDRPQTPPPGWILSDRHYWRIGGVNLGSFKAKASFYYNGSNNGGLLDAALFGGLNENSLMLLYRPNAAANWQKLNSATLNKGGSATDKMGSFTVASLQFGEYTLAINDPNRTDTLTMPPNDCLNLTALNQPPNNNNTNSHKQGYLQVQPNPNNGQFAVNISLPATAVPQMAILQVADSAGRIIYTQNINNTGGTQQQSITINLAQPLTAGTYKVSVKTNSYVLASTMVVL